MVNEGADEEPMIVPIARARPPAELGDGNHDRGETTIEPGRVLVEQWVDQATPTEQAVARILQAARFHRRPGPVEQVGVDLEEGGTTIGIDQLGGVGTDESAGQSSQVAARIGLVAIEQPVPLGFDRHLVTLENGFDQAIAATEVVLHGDDVASPGSPGDLPHAGAIEAALGEKLLSSGDEPIVRSGVAHRNTPAGVAFMLVRTKPPCGRTGREPPAGPQPATTAG